MPRRDDLKRILVIGAGPIVIGQACEFDYSGTQACKALRSEGLEVILINSNPATIMTDPEMADRTYIEPLTVEAVTAVIAKERPDAILPTVGGQTALNLAVSLHEAGVLDEYGVTLIGANVDAIKLGEDRLLFRDAMKEIGVETPASGLARSGDEALRIVKTTGFPAIIRPSFTMGGVNQMLLTHKDDVADHELFRKRFNCQRLMHADDGAARLGVEQVIRGEEPVQLDDDLLVIPTPGHTRGHVVYLYKNKFLFTGDHLAWSPVRQTLTAFRSVAWYSWPEQTRSMEKLLSYEFEWVLPGHGDMHHGDAHTMHAHLERCVSWMKTLR